MKNFLKNSNTRKYYLFILIFLLCKNNTIGELESHFSTPESTIIHYWSQLSKRDYKNALKCFSDFSEKHFNEKDIFPIPEDIDSIKVDSIFNLIIKGNKAEICYRVVLYRDTLVRTFKSGDRLMLTNQGWKIKDVVIPK